MKITFYSAIFLKVTNLKVFAESKKGHFAKLIHYKIKKIVGTQPRTGFKQ